mgnify:CR=1 FL=1
MNRFFTLLAMCVLAIGTAFADETTIVFENLYQSDKTVQPATPVSFGAFSFSFEKGNSGTQPAYFISTSTSAPAKEMRLYGGPKASPLDGNTMTVTATTAMTKMVFDGGSNFSSKWVEVKASEGTVEFNTSTRVLTWTGNASSVTFTVYSNASTSGQWRFAKATITTGAAGEVTVSKPTFSRAAGTFYSPFNLELRTATTGADIYYTTDGTDPTTASAKYSAPIAISRSATVEAFAVLNGKASDIASAEYVMGEATEVANIAAYQAIADETQAVFGNPVTVLAQNGNNLYVKDNTGYALFYGNTGKTFKNGDEILAGFNGKKTTYKGEPELKVDANSGLEKGSNTPVAAEVIQVSDIAKDMFAHYVVIKGATTSYLNRTITDKSGSAGCQSGMGGFSAKNDSVNVDVYGIVGTWADKTTGDISYVLLPTAVKQAGDTTSTEGVTIAEYQTVANDTEVTFRNPVTVLAQGGANLWVRDNTGYMLVYGNTGKTYAQGDVIPAGFSGTKVTYNGEPELKTPKGFKAATGKETVTPEELALTDANINHANFGHYILVKGATINTSASTITDAAGNSFAYFNNMSAQLPKDLTKKYNVYAIIGSHYNKSTKGTDYQLLPVTITNEDGSALPVDPVADINGLYGLATGVKGMISDELTVIYQNGSNMWVKDNAGTYGLVYGYITNKFVNGDKIKNLVAHWVTYDGYKEIIPVDESAVKSGEGSPVEAEELALEELSQDMVHRYVTIPGVALTSTETAATYNGNDGTVDMQIYNKFSSDVTIPENLAGKTFRVTGFVAMYKNQLQLIPVEVKNEAAGSKGDINGDGAVNASDVTALINKVLGDANFADDACDINADGTVNVSDVTALINLILE